VRKFSPPEWDIILGVFTVGAGFKERFKTVSRIITAHKISVSTSQ
jgi:hypothetical protein